VAVVNNLAIKKNTSASKTNVLVKPGVAVAQPLAGSESDPKKETSHSLITYNHMENNYHLSNKKALYYNMKIYYESAGGQDWFNVLPLTFHIKEGANDKEYLRFTELFKDYDSGKTQGAYEKLGKQIWIVKPGENTNRGCGIQVCRELSQIKEIISNTNFNG
jgi:tubulin--tyrosine ligase